MKMLQILRRISLKYTLLQTIANVSRVQNQAILKPICPSHHRCISHAKYESVVNQELVDRVNYMMLEMDESARKLGRLSVDKVRNILNMIKTTGYISTPQSAMLVGYCGSLLAQEYPETRMKLVHETWKTLETLGLKRDIRHYNALLSVYLENEYEFVPSDFLADLKKKQIVPNVETYQRLITKHCQCGEVSCAFQILQLMREEDMPINIGVFNSLILGHSQANDMENAERVLDIMKKAGVMPSSDTFTLLVCGHIQQKNLGKADSLLRGCKRQHIFFTPKNYTDIIHAYVINGFSDKIDEVLSRLSKAHVREATKLIFKLIMTDKVKEAFKILKFMMTSYRESGTQLPFGNFFVAHLIRCDVSPNTVIEYCVQLMEDNMNPYAFNVAIQNCLQLNKDKMALVLLRAAKENDVPVRFHYFWPLLVQHGKRKDVVGILSLLSIMHNEFGIVANSETLRNYVVPYLVAGNNDVAFLAINLESFGISVSSFTTTAVISLLTEQKIQEAANFAKRYDAHYPVNLIKGPLVTSFLFTKDIQSFVTLLKEFGADWFHNKYAKTKNEHGTAKAFDYRKYTGQILEDAIRGLVRQNSDNIIGELFQQLLRNEVGISVESFDAITNILGNKATPEMTEVMRELTSKNFATPRCKVKRSKISLSSLDTSSLERVYEIMRAIGEPTTQVKKQLFLAYARDINLEKLLEIKKELDAENFVLSKNMYALLLDTFVECDKPDEAMNVCRTLLERESGFNLDWENLLKLALLLVQHGRYDEAFETLRKKHNEVKGVTTEASFDGSSLCRRILDVLAENGDVERLEEFIDFFLSNKLIEVNNIHLGSLIKVHLKRGDIDSAVKEFEKCVLKYKATPWRTELCRVLIQNEDAANVQRVTSVSAEVHGKSDSLYSLILLYMECGRVGQARKLLQNSGERLRADLLILASTKYRHDGASKHLLNLLELTKGIRAVDRSEIYHRTLQVYNDANDPENSLSLWMQMQEENEIPTDEFLITLAGILNRNNVPVPFNVPAKLEGTDQSVSRKHNEPRISSSSAELKKLIDSGEINEALKLLKQSKPKQLTKTDWSLLIEACVTKNRYTEAKSLMFEYYSKTGDLPYFRILKYLLGAAMKIPDVELFEDLNDHLSNDVKKRLSFDNRCCRTYLNAGRGDKFLTRLEQSLDNARTKEELDAYIEAFPYDGILLISESPEYSSRVGNLLSECLKRDDSNIFVANTLWEHYMSNEQFSDADMIWKTYLQNTEQAISFRNLMNVVVKRANTELGVKIVNTMESKCNISSSALGVVYGALISAYVKKTAVKEALDVLERALSRVELKDIMKPSLVMLKAAASAKNIAFPYEIPVTGTETRVK